MMHRAAVALLALLLGLQPAQAQNFNFIAPTPPPGTSNNQIATTEFVQNSAIAGVSSIGGATGAISLGYGLSIGGGTVTATIPWTNTRLAKTANYTVANADKGKTIALGGSAYYTLTFDAAAGYDANYANFVVNEDSGRAKLIAPNGVASCKLWPLQTAIVYNQNNVWRTMCPNRWKHPGGTLDVYANYSLGSDSNDCLAPGAGNACQSVQAALYLMCDQVDFNGSAANRTQGYVHMASGVIDAAGVHYSCAQPGSQGGQVITITGDGTGAQIHPAAADALGVFVKGTRVYLEGDIIIASDSGHGIVAQLGGEVTINSPNIKLSTVVGAQLYAKDAGSEIIINTDYGIAGGGGEHYLIKTGGTIRTNEAAHTVTWTVNGSFTTFALLNNGNLSVPAMTYACANAAVPVGAFTCGGKHFDNSNFSVIYTAGGGASYLPGTVAGTNDAASGAFYNFLLKRDLHHDNDNTPMWLDQAA